ncbi:MAG TPA: DUF6600 domain-containing protein [Gemmatimonadales bacterium]|jgi:hypothetical protein
MRLTAVAAFALTVIIPQVAGSQQGPDVDPPARVGRVSALDGPVSLYPVGGSDWTTALLNYPLTGGDALWADSAARAEVHLGSSAIRIAARTALTFGEISDSVTQVRVDEGSIDVHVRALDDNEVYEIDTPSGVISLVIEGHYRIDVWPEGRRTTVTVRDGEAAVERDDGGDPWTVPANTSATLLSAGTAPRIGSVVPVDDWERWADSRDQREDDSRSTEFVSRETVGYEDLDDFGNWQVDPSYGNVWYPRAVPSGWAPYRSGRWISVGAWGWTWIDQEPWGFAPFHYGRWAYLRGHWGWVPGPPQLRPVYAPALVAFVGGAGWSGGVGDAIGWVPLAPGEPYLPSYHASAGYVRRVNPLGFGPPRVAGHTGSVGDYANRNAPGALTAIPRDAFTKSRPVPAVALPVRSADIAAARPFAPPTPPPPARTTGRGTGRPSTPTRAPNRPADGRRPPVATAATPLPAPWHGRPRPAAPEPDRTAPPVVRQDPPLGAPVAPPHTAPVPAPPPADVPRHPLPAGRPAPRPSGAPGQQPQQAPSQPQPPAAGQPAAPPAPAGRPDRPTQRPGTPQPTADPAAPPRVPEVRPRPAPVVRPPDANLPADNAASAQWQQQRAQLVQRQEAENAALARQQAAQHAAQQAAANQAQAQQQQAAQRKALDDKQQHQRDQLDKQYRRPVPAKTSAPPPPPPDHKPA